MDEAAVTESVRKSRFWLYTPFVLLVLVAIAWSVAWFVIRGRATDSIDAWFGLEARSGRQWTCQDRHVGGYPFRLEVTCGSLSLKHGAVTASFGQVESVAQIYQPRLVITEIAGPLRVSDGKVTVEGRWDLLQTSVHAAANGLQRLSAVAKTPTVTITGLMPEPIVMSSQGTELHIRPNPSRSQENAYDFAATVKQAMIPTLDGFLGGTEPTDLQTDMTLTHALGFRGRPVAEELERWRGEGGKLDILMLALNKGARRMEVTGSLGIDEQHRPAGTLNVAAAGLDGLLGNVVGGRSGGALLGALLGTRGAPAGAANKPALTPLPPLRLENGFLALGPFVIPSVRLPVLY